MLKRCFQKSAGVMGYYKDIIILLLIFVPYIIFVRNTYIARDRETLKKALLSIAIGWVMVVVSAVLITGIDYLLANSEYDASQIASVAIDRVLFAVLLGWVFPAIVIFFAWVLHLGINKIRRRWFPHIVFKRF